MRSQRLAFFLAILLVLSLIMTAGLGLQMGELSRLRQEVENFATEQQRLRETYEARVQDLRQRADDIDADLSEAQSSLDQLRTELDRVKTQRDELQAERDQLQQRARQLERQVKVLNSMNPINDQVVGLRGLNPQSLVPRDVLTREQFRQRLLAGLENDFPPEAERRQRAKLMALDMIKPGIDLRSAVIESQVQSVLGFYDPRSKELFVVSDRETMSVEDRITYAHEYIHSLQDQSFDLAGLQRSAPSADAGLALRALIEGDATLGMSLWAEEHLTEFDWLNYRLDQLQRIANLFGQSPGSISTADSVVESIGHFPYTYGADFASMLYYEGGWSAINRAFSNPPRSSAQVLHPQLYYQNVQPVGVALPNLSAALGSAWEELDNDVLGEFYLRVYLEHEIDIPTAASAAAGWRGDRYAILQNQAGRYCLAIRTRMSSQAEAAELFAAYTAYVERKGAARETPFTAAQRLWEQPDRQIYLSRAGGEVLILHAPDSTALTALRGAFPGF